MHAFESNEFIEQYFIRCSCCFDIHLKFVILFFFSVLWHCHSLSYKLIYKLYCLSILRNINSDSLLTMTILSVNIVNILFQLINDFSYKETYCLNEQFHFSDGSQYLLHNHSVSL